MWGFSVGSKMRDSCPQPACADYEPALGSKGVAERIQLCRRCRYATSEDQGGPIGPKLPPGANEAIHAMHSHGVNEALS